MEKRNRRAFELEELLTHDVAILLFIYLIRNMTILLLVLIYHVFAIIIIVAFVSPPKGLFMNFLLLVFGNFNVRFFRFLLFLGVFLVSSGVLFCYPKILFILIITLQKN